MVSSINHGFEELLFVLPEKKVSVESLVLEAGFDATMVNRLHANGLKSILINQNKSLDILVNASISDLNKKIPDFAERTCGIVFAHSLPILAPACIHFLALCVKGHNLDQVNRIAITGQPCSILHAAIQASIGWLKEQPLDKGILLIGADQAYSAEERIFFDSAMGDVAIAGFITKNANKNIILTSISETEIIAYEGELSPREDIEKFRELNPMYIRHAINSAMEKANINLSDIKYIIPHTPNKLIWDVMSKLLKIPRNLILDTFIEETGHLNSNDSFCHYIRACKEHLIESGDKVILINPGFGGTRGCTILQR